MSTEDHTPPSDVTATPVAAPEGEAPAAPPSEGTPPVEATPTTTAAPTPHEAPKQAPEPDLDTMLARKDIRAEITRQVKIAAKKAQEEEQARAAQEAERAKMEEVERLKLEKADAEKVAREAQKQALDAQRDRDLANTIVSSNIKLANGSALDFVRHEAYRACDAHEDLTMEDAVQRVIDAHPYLVQTEAPAPQDTSGASSEHVPGPPARPTTVTVTRATQTPADTQPPPEVDVMALSPEEYRQYKRANHGLH